MGVEGATSPFKQPRSGSRRCYCSGEKNCKRKIFFPLFPLNRYNSAPIGPIFTTRRALSRYPAPVLVRAIVSEKKILGSYSIDLDEKNMGVECATSPCKRPRSGSPRCYSFGEKNS
ncbi:hypothetical protein V1477_006398 [Vespula maculifrons]|uniref:Uncharacterized protein n=1 Tax=Vespula maculifrons TaxID=7453 RepID=A0ABD2CKB6_VESMC